MNALHLCVLMFDCITYGEFYFYTRITFLRDSNDEDTYNFLFRTIFFRVIASTRITLSKLRRSKKSELCMLSIPTSNGIFMPKKYNKHLMTVYACVCVMCAYVCALNMNSQVNMMTRHYSIPNLMTASTKTFEPSQIWDHPC